MHALLHDLSRLSIAVGTCAALAWAGVLLLALVARPWRDRLIPAAPALGACLVVVVLHWTSLFVGTDAVALPLAILAVTITGVLLVRFRHRLTVSRRSAAFLLVGVLAGAPAVMVAMQPTFAVDAGEATMPTGNHDSFWFVSVSAWLQEHRGNEYPRQGAVPSPSLDSRAYAPADQAVRFNFRLGEPLIQAASTSITRLPSTVTWYPTQASWLFLLPGALAALASLMGMRTEAGLAAGAVGGMASLLTYQVFNQNTASVLAIVLLPLVLGLVTATLRERLPWRVGVPLAALALCGLAGVYFELLPLIALGFVIVVLFPKTGATRRIRTAARIVVAALVMGPFIWFNTIESFRGRSSLVPNWPLRRFWTDDLVSILARIFGLVDIDALQSFNLVFAGTFVLVIAGLGLTCRRRDLGVLVAGFLVSATAVWVIQGRRGDYYAVERLGSIVGPVVLMFSGLGWFDALSRLRQPRRLAPALVATAVLVPTLVAANVRSSLGFLSDRATLTLLGVTDATDEAGRWGREFGGPTGADLTVVTESYVDRLWLADALRTRPETSFPYLTPDYFGVPQYSDGRVRRYLLASRGVFLSFPSRSIVRSNASFVLIDTSVAPGVAVLPTENWWQPERHDGQPAEWMYNDGRLLVLQTNPGSAVQLHMRSVDTLTQVELTVVAPDTTVLGTVVVGEEPAALAVPTVAAQEAYLELRNSPLAARAGNGDQRPLSVLLSGVGPGSPAS